MNICVTVATVGTVWIVWTEQIKSDMIVSTVSLSLIPLRIIEAISNCTMSRTPGDEDEHVLESILQQVVPLSYSTSSHRGASTASGTMHGATSGVRTPEHHSPEQSVCRLPSPLPLPNLFLRITLQSVIYFELREFLTDHGERHRRDRHPANSALRIERKLPVIRT